MAQSPQKAIYDIVACCWSIPERMQIERIRYLCEKCPQLELDGGQTDEGDPWLVVYDPDREQVVLHIARIDSRYVMARATQPKPYTVMSLSTAINAKPEDLIEDDLLLMGGTRRNT